MLMAALKFVLSHSITISDLLIVYYISRCALYTTEAQDRVKHNKQVCSLLMPISNQLLTLQLHYGL